METITSPLQPLNEKEDTNNCSPLTPPFLHKSLLITDGLFFVQNISDDTFKSCWDLMKINYDDTEKLNMEPRAKGDCHGTFLSRHSSDNSL